ncbi:MAG TPA: hypothetical protein VGX28_12240 [Frankiaceae bacterium]|jgi:hypothetical protein|nr:hypothetical protein [Frankiaceae bacterium]
MPTLTADEVRNQIDAIVDGYRAARAAAGPSVVPELLTAGKLYEAWVLCDVLEKLKSREGYQPRLRQGTKVVLKSSPGPINRAYPYFEIARSAGAPLEVFTDVEFLTLSYDRRGMAASPQDGDFHELDIVVVPQGVVGRPRHDEVLLGVECKNTVFAKELLRAILGVRRELSYLQEPRNTRFRKWPRPTVPADPPSCLLVYSTDVGVTRFDAPGAVFGVDFIHERLP